MLIRKAYKFQLVTRQSQEQRLWELVGCARYVWNEALAECRRMLAAGERLPGYNGYGGYASWIGHWSQLDARRVKLPAGLGWVRLRRSRDIEGVIKNCTSTSSHSTVFNITRRVWPKPKERWLRNRNFFKIGASKNCALHVYTEKLPIVGKTTFTNPRRR